MIIAAYAGAGKSQFAKQVNNAKDIVSMPHRWILPGNHSKNEESESLKAADYLVANPLYTDQYVLEILKAEKEYDFVIIPTAEEIINKLVMNYGRNVVICCPDESLKEEYKKRYTARGNSEQFLEIFYENWDRIISGIKHIGQGMYEDKISRLTMKSGEYLSDLEPKLRLIKLEFEPATQVPHEALLALQNEIQELKTQFCICAYTFERIVVYPIKSLDDDCDRELIFELGRTLCNMGLMRPWIRLKEDVMYSNDPDNYVVVDSKEEFIEKLREGILQRRGNI